MLVKHIGAKKFLINKFLKSSEQFVYLRRYENELKKALPTFYNDIIYNNEFPDVNLKIKNKKFFINDNCAGYAMRMTEAQDLKGSSFNNVSTILFDEFIIEKSRRCYLPSEVDMFLGIIESIARMRPIRCFLLGNSVTTTNPYYLYFNIDRPYNSDIKLFKNGLILVQHIQNTSYSNTKLQTRFGQLVSDTPYADYAIDNKFLEDSNNNFIEKKSGTLRFLFAFKFKDQTLGVWHDKNSDKLYVSFDFIKNTPFMFATTLEDHSENTMFFKSAKKYNAWRVFIDSFQLGYVRFESQKIKSICTDIIKKILI